MKTPEKSDQEFVPQQQLQAQQPQQTNTQADQMVETLLHDLKNPLSIIYGCACLLQQQKDIKDRYREEAIEGIMESVGEMRKLISDWLNLSKIEAGRKLEFERLPFLQFVNNCVDSFYTLAQSNDLDLSFSALSQDQEIEFDHDRMVQAINNLISNAIKYTPRGGKVTITGHFSHSYALIIVADTGIGIDTQSLPKIFDRFYRANHESMKRIEGIGLGLAISKAIIERHNGTIEVKSEVGEGTAFTIKLPSQQAV